MDVIEFQPHHHTPTPQAPHKPEKPAAHHKPHQPAKPQKPAGPASTPHRQGTRLHRQGHSTPRGHSSAPRDVPFEVFLESLDAHNYAMRMIDQFIEKLDRLAKGES